MKQRILKRISLLAVIGVLGVSSVSAAGLFTKQPEVDNAPVVGLYRFQVPEDLQGPFNSVGVENFISSMAQEPNTLSMNIAHVKGSQGTAYVLEIYKDSEALDVHRKSEHFKKYLSEVGSKLSNRRIYDVQPMILMEKASPLEIINDGVAIVTLTSFTVQKDRVDDVQKQYELDISRAIRDDEGYKAGYILRDTNNRNQWYVVQIYSDDVAYKKHVSSPGYRFAMGQIKGYVQNSKTEVLQGDILVNHGGQSFVRP